MSAPNLPTHMRQSYVSKLVPRNPTVLLGLIILTSVVDSVTIGYDGSIMGSLLVMDTFSGYFSLDTATTSLSVCFIFVGGAIGALFAPFVANKRGRKEGMLYAAVLQIIGVILQTAAQNISMFIVGRFIIGLGTGIANVAAPVYVAETAPAKFRALALGLYYTCWAVGTLLASGICYGTESMASTWAWRIPTLIQAVPSVFCILILFVIPESPRWLAYTDQSEHALEVISVVHGTTADSPIVLLQYREIIDTINFEKSEGQSLGFMEVIKSPENRKRLFCAVSVAPLAMLTGSNIITFYFGTMLSGAGITNAHTQLEINIILSAWQLVCATAGSLCAEKIGRKWLACLSIGSGAVFLFMFGGLTGKYGTSDNSSGVYGTVACMFLFLGAYSYGMTPLTVIYPPEVLSYSMRGSGMALFTFTTKVCGLIASFVIPYILNSIAWKTYMVNATFDVLCVFFVYFYWVETKNLTLEEIDEKFDGIKHSDVPNLGAIMRGEADMSKIMEANVEEV